MKTVIFFLLTSVLSVLAKDLHPLSDEYIAEINSKQSTWVAARYFDDWDLFKTLATGSVLSTSGRKLQRRVHDEEDAEIPTSFDAREAWPECADVIGMIRDQSRCGACWAFSAVEAMSDRICISSSAQRKLVISSQHPLTCIDDDGGCYGGDPDDVWTRWDEEGIVTGGLYNHTEQGCQSYFLPPCDDHLNKCQDYVETPECVRTCDDNTQIFKNQLTYGLMPYALYGEKQIQLEIQQHGPVSATYMVYEDFANYKSGIYQSTSDNLLGGHAVKIIGWGEENGVKYWLIANSWNEKWGENGFFRILRGVDECGIEENVAAGLPNFNRF